MTNTTKRLREKIDGLELSVECETAVVEFLKQSYVTAWDAGDRQPKTMRGVQQWSDSKRLVEQWTQEILDLNYCLALVKDYEGERERS